MRTSLPSMTREQILIRAEAKRALLLQFLASGERWTTVELAAMLLTCARPRALATLKAMERDRLIKSEQLDYGPKIYGISSHGLALAGQSDRAPFEVGRTKLVSLPHHLSTQRLRLQAEGAGWTDWVPGKTLLPGPVASGMFATKAPKRKIPDALATRPRDQRRVAVEIELTIKRKRDYREILALYLQDIAQKRYHSVHYVSRAEVADSLRAIFAGIDTIPVLGATEKFEDKHRARFPVFTLEEWPPKD